MSQINSSQLIVNATLGDNPASDATLVIVIEPSTSLRVGTYRFRLEVFDEAGNRSGPEFHNLQVLDTEAPTARITGPREIAFGLGFTLDGRESTDVGGGQIARFLWTLVERP